MGDARAGRYWCHACSEVVHPVWEVEPKCPLCHNGFVEEMDGREEIDTDSDLESDHALSLWSSILLGMMGGFLRRSRLRRGEEDDESDHEFEDFLRRRRRSSAILQLLQSLQDDIWSESDNPESERERERERERESVILINPFHQAIILQGTLDSDRNQSRDSSNTGVGASSGDYFVGPGLDLLLQHLVENDPNRYGTPPAQKEAINALPTVKIEENMSCSVCLEDVAIGTEVKEMPCKHKFHNGCILPWLELHSSCPVCRFQLPADESKVSNGSRNGDSRVEGTGGNGGDEGDGFWLPVPWPFNGLFSLSGSENGGNSSSNSPSSTASGSDSHSEES
ncbi:E3 ubiquitin-protein ligase SIRP1 [Elaeis guineensis]|uniref:RING-type E3 ubiquitin transferase n=1 Tax=Elaeis guineensis var. tenera TaxID=51953 RepID=A0A6I9RGK1_ELAGV|nr:E3 ubiquitin-protein ligase SIRP1 [Elaeis guineensis]XP_010922892.1 E3 ubiquitin-protein ligase SIRP1 [Elaeis guineensis]XP_029120553.1 E3 ubiquitin-protein ligase SIRP1 [Elaeis guineensis]